MSLLDIQSCWQVPYIAHFCSSFSKNLNLPKFEIEDLETAFLNAQSLHGNDGTGTIINEKSDLLTEIIVSLIRGYLPKSKCTIKNYQLHLHPILANYKPTTNNLIADYKNIDFPEWPLSIKIDCLQLLCEIRLNADDISPIFSELVADSLRVKPLGTDSHGSIYWYFFETRLYREDRKENSSVCQWQLLCETEVDWINLLEKLAEFRADENLYHLLDDIFRSITRLFRRKALAQQRKLIEVRRSSRLSTANFSLETEKIVANPEHDKENTENLRS